MKKNALPPENENKKDLSAYYKLNIKAVDDLVTAAESNSPVVPEEELRKFKSGAKWKLPAWIQPVFIKFWVPAAVCFFFLWGLSPYVGAMLDLLVVTGIALGFASDLITDNILRFTAKQEGGHDAWMMFPKKRYLSLPLNVLYSGFILFLIFRLYTFANQLLISIGGLPEDAVPWGVEPIGFGLVYLLLDLIFLGIKYLLIRVAGNGRQKTVRGN